MTMTDPDSLRQDSDTDRDTAADQRGSKGLNPGEQARLDQIQSGLKGDDGGTGAGTKVAPPGKTGTTAGEEKAGAGAAGLATSSAGGAMGAAKVVKAAASRKGNSKGPLMAGGAVGLIIALMLAAFAALLPLKLESMMENIFEKRISDRIEYYMESRMQSMIEKYLEASVGSDDAEFAKSIVATGAPLRDLYKTWRVRKFETSLDENQGVRFQKNPDGSIDVFQDGDLVGNLSKVDAVDVISDSVRSETEWYQFYKRMHLRTWMREAYGITKWDVYQNVINKVKCSITTCTDDDAAAKALKTSQATDAEGPATQAGVLDVECALSEGATCIEDPNDPENPGLDGEGLQSDDKTNTDDEGDPQVEASVQDAEQQAFKESEKTAGAEGSKLTERVLMKILPDAIAKAISNVLDDIAGPLIVIGIIDMASRIDHFFWYGGADRVIVGAHEVEYAAQFAEWLTMADQWKDGSNISGDEFNATMQELNGTENSAAFRQVYGTGTGGQDLDTVDNGSGTAANDTEGRTIDQQAHPIENWYRSFAGIVPVPPSLIPVHYELAEWYDTGGKVWGWLQDAVGSILGFVWSLFMDFLEVVAPPLAQVMTLMFDLAGKLLTDVMMLLIKPAVTGLEVGADLFNDLDAGAVVTGLGFAEDLGAPPISASGAQQLNTAIGLAQQQQNDQMSIATRLFSPDYAHSLVNNIALTMPSTPSGAMDDSVSYAAALLSNPFKVFASIPQFLGIVSNASAAGAAQDSPQNLYGMNDWGFTPSQLQGDDTAALDAAWATATTRLGHTPTYGDLEQTDCPNVPNEGTLQQTQPNLCRLDIETIQSLGAKYTSGLDGGMD